MLVFGLMQILDWSFVCCTRIAVVRSWQGAAEGHAQHHGLENHG